MGKGQSVNKSYHTYIDRHARGAQVLSTKGMPSFDPVLTLLRTVCFTLERLRNLSKEGIQLWYTEGGQCIHTVSPYGAGMEETWLGNKKRSDMTSCHVGPF